MQAQINVTMTQVEALAELRKSVSNSIQSDFPCDVNVIVIGINDDLEEQRRTIIKRCRKLIDSNQKIEAIKEFRKYTNAGLKDARDILESETKMENYIRTGEI